MGILKENTDKAGSLAKEVRNLIDREPYIRNPLSEGLINYSALARKIAPRVEKNLGRKVKEESIIVAIKRYADETSPSKESNNYLNVFARSTLSMQEDITYLTLKSNAEVLGSLEGLINEPDWQPGEVRIIVEAPQRTVVVLKSSRAKSLIDKVRNDLIEHVEDNVLVTLSEPPESKSTYGVIAEVTAILSKKGISVELISGPPNLHFLVNEENGNETYNTLKEIIKYAKTVEEEN